MSSRHTLDPKHTDPKRVARERQKARDLRGSPWWKSKISLGLCHYCHGKFPPTELTMDHVVPIARGGESVKNNIVPACKSCNTNKKLSTPVDDAFAQLERERLARESASDPSEGNDA